MLQYEDFLAHVVNLASRNKFVCLMPGKELTPPMREQVDAQVQTHEDRLGRFYNFFLSHGLDGADLGLFDFVKEHLVGLGAVRGGSGEALARLSQYLPHVDLIAVQMGTLGARFLAAVRGDRHSPGSLPAVAEALNGIGAALLELQGAWKLKLAGLNLGKGVGMDATGSALFAFADPTRLAQLRPSLEGLQLGTPAGERFWKGLKSSVVNPLLFGHKGSVNLSKLIFRLSDRAVEVPGFWRSLTAKVGVVDRFYFGLTPEELLPPPR
jgi:hypothetical protein